jgi:hypothetical protein
MSWKRNQQDRERFMRRFIRKRRLAGGDGAGRWAASGGVNILWPQALAAGMIAPAFQVPAWTRNLKGSPPAPHGAGGRFPCSPGQVDGRNNGDVTPAQRPPPDAAPSVGKARQFS